jgi:hypothetical protein
MSGLLKRLFGGGRRDVPAHLPYELLVVKGSEAQAILRALDARGGGTPILHGSPVSYTRLVESYRSNPAGVEQLIAAARELDIQSWLNDSWGQVEEDRLSDPEVALEGEWPDEAISVQSTLFTPQSHDGGFLPEVNISQLPTAEHWLAPCYLKFGSWNACPAPEIHAALLLRWWRSNGARVRAITSDGVELEIQRPVADRDAALRIAKEHFVYCSEGDQTIKERAADLIGSSFWYFWWD